MAKTAEKLLVPSGVEGLDGLIHLKTDRLDDKLIREMTIIKARASEVRSPDAVFTLYHGFKVLTPPSLPKIGLVQSVNYPADPPGGYTTGIPDLDREIGGYPDGSTVLFETDSKLTYKEYNLVLAPAIAGYIAKKRPCILVPSGGVSSGDIMAFTKIYGLSREYVQKYIYVIVESGVDEEGLPNIIQMKPDEQVAERLANLASSLNEKFGSPPVMSYGIDRVVRLYGEKALDLMHIAQDRVRRRGGLAIWLVKPTRPWLSERLAPIADMHFKIMRRHGCILLYGIKPRTPLYAVRTSEENPIPRLIPIV